MSSVGDTNDDIAQQAPCDPLVTDETTTIVDGSNVSNNPLKRDYKSKSNIWGHFSKIKKKEGEKSEKAACNYCGKTYGSASINGTSNMWKHLKNCSKYPYNEVDKKQKLLSFQKRSGEEGKDITSIEYLHSWKFDQESCRMALARWIITSELPFKIIETDGFLYLMRMLQPRFTLISRTTLTRDCMKLYATEKEKLKKSLVNMNAAVSLTTDCWTSLQNLSYLCLTAHFIDDDWKLQKRILNFCVISSHKGKELGKVLESCILNWEIDRVCTLTVDNATANTVAIDHLRRKLNEKAYLPLDGAFFHMRCACHILNLIVKDGMNEKIDTVARVRDAVKYIRSSPMRSHQFKICCEKEKIEYKGSVCMDVPTRWNSTYQMLQVAIKFQKAFERFEDEVSEFAIDLENGPPQSYDWENAKLLVSFLEKFYVASNLFSGSSYITSSAYFEQIFFIGHALNEWVASSNLNHQTMAIKMKAKFEKYWGNIDKVSILLVIASVLDPRNKLEFVRHCYEFFFTKEQVSGLMDKVVKVFKEMFEYYKKLDAMPTTSTNARVESMELDQPHNTPNASSLKEMRQLRAAFIERKKALQTSSNQSELDKYLSEECDLDDLSSQFDILNWWKANSSKYKILSSLARDILAIPVSTVASESAFSTGGRVLDRFRSSLSPMIVEGLVCTQDWLRASPLSLQIEEDLHQIEELENDICSEQEAFERG